MQTMRFFFNLSQKQCWNLGQKLSPHLVNFVVVVFDIVVVAVVVVIIIFVNII